MTSLKRETKWYLIGGLLALVFTICWAGCSTSSTPIPIPTTEPTLTLVPLAPTPIPISTAQPTLTPTSTPSPTLTLARASTTEPTLTPTLTPSPIPTHTPTPEPDGVVMHNSGIIGTTSYFVVSGVPGGGTTGGRRSLEFAIAPMEGDSPAYDKAIFVTSEADGTYKVDLALGTYWIGPTWKVPDRINYGSGPSVFSEKVAVVKEGAFTQIDLSHTGYLP